MQTNSFLYIVTPNYFLELTLGRKERSYTGTEILYVATPLAI